MKILLIDNFDSFTYNLVDYLARGGASCDVYRNDISPAAYEGNAYTGIVLSPGPGRPAEAGYLMEIVAHYAGRLPMLGVCLGHQAIGEYFGARLEKGLRPMHGKVSAISCQPTGLFAGLPSQFDVVRYHSLVLASPLPSPLEATAYTAAGELMALQHRTWPIWGVQFHPEAALTAYGQELVCNWLTLSASVAP